MDKKQGLDGNSIEGFGGMNTSYDSYTLHINTDYVHQTLEDRIQRSRVVVNKNHLDVTSQSEVRSDTRGRRGLDPTSVYWQNLCAILIQRVVRVFLAKKVLRRKKKDWLLLKAIIIAQRTLRGALGRKQFRDAKKIFQRRMHYLRHHVLNRHQAAKLIVKVGNNRGVNKRGGLII